MGALISFILLYDIFCRILLYNCINNIFKTILIYNGANFMISKPWLTAIHRTKQSAPMRYLLDNNLINKQQIILDYGCGYGFDVKHLSQLGY